jgi:hypothetical protein
MVVEFQCPSCKAIFNSDSMEPPLKCPKCGIDFCRNQDFNEGLSALVKRFGTDDVNVLRTIVEMRTPKPLINIREGTEPQKKGDMNEYYKGKFETDKLAEVKAILDKARVEHRAPPAVDLVTVEKTVRVERQPWEDGDTLFIPDMTPEDRDAAIAAHLADLGEKARSVELVDGEGAFYSTGLSPAPMTSGYPRLTLAESRAKANRMPIEFLKDTVAAIPMQIKAYETAEADRRALAVKDQSSLYDYPNNPDQHAAIMQQADDLIRAYSEVGTFEKMKKAIPHLQELLAMYEDVLKQKIQEQKEQQARAGYVLKNIEVREGSRQDLSAHCEALR